MNYSEFYRKATDELNSTFLFLNARGDTAYKDHMEDMLRAEPLVRKPVFQTIFPWESHSGDMQSLQGLLGADLINALDKATFQDPLDPNAKVEHEEFPKTRHPFVHQVNAWTEALASNQSILVTTGTGSGKTECFMIPILKELYDARCSAIQQGANVGIQAIFLYPLNALIASQRKRIHAWVSALPKQITYCNYNGELDETRSAADRTRCYPQIIDRQQMRLTPPQILFTNPSMLEYMMVRTADQDLKQNSDLKWIVLDEAHCYNGSSATELALQIKRVLKFFGKKPAQVKFAITSATISTDPARQAQMHKFIEELTGKVWSSFTEIGGRRVVEQIDYADPGTAACIANINARNGVSLNDRIIDNLRRELNERPALSLDEIAEMAGMPAGATIEDKLRLVDDLANEDPACPARKLNNIVKPDTTALLPTRAHFYVRSVEGVYACTNPQCPGHNAYRPLELGRLTTYKSVLCPQCHGKMLEVVRCSQCNELLLQGLRTPSGTPGTPDSYSIMDMEHNEDLLVDLDDSQSKVPGNAMLLDAQCRIATPPLPSGMIVSPMPCVQLDAMSGNILPAGPDHNYLECIKGNECLCPKCGEKQNEMQPVMMMPNMIQTHLTRILLNQSQPATTITASTVYDGRKFISFTDNRQKTANTARFQNVDSERNWIRGAIYHALVDCAGNGVNGMSINAVQQQIASLVALNNPMFAPTINALKASLAQVGRQRALDIKNRYYSDDQLTKLHSRFNGAVFSLADYLTSLVFDQMGNRSLRSASSLEALGLVHWVYPAIEQITSAPQSFVDFYGFAGSSDPAAVREWKNLLKVLIDVTIRGGRHIVMPDKIDNILPHSYFALPIYGAQATYPGHNIRTWLNFDRTADVYRREFVLMLLAKGITDKAAVTGKDESDVNGILADAWNLLTSNRILVPDGGLANGFQGYKLDIFDNNPQALLALQMEGVMCPVTKQILDVTFMGLSPMIKGELCAETKARYTVNSQPVNIPAPGFTRSDAKFQNTNGSFNKDAWTADVIDWLDTVYKPAVEPVWGDVNSQNSIITFDNVFIAREHSAQLDSKDLRESERKFMDGELNVLDCSTTMEMGVDIGGLTVVTMNNVAPKPQNYQQRVGRAGRRGEQKALALTIYGDNPIGRAVEANPSWALEHEIEPSALSFASENIVYRHVCATLFAYYLSTAKITLKDYLGDFVMGTNLTTGLPALYTYQGYVAFLNQLRSGTHADQTTIQTACQDLVNGTCLQSLPFTGLIDYASTKITEVYNVVFNYIQNLTVQIAAAANKRYASKLSITRENLWNKNLFSYLGEKDYLPNAYMPTNVTDLILPVSNTRRRISNPQRETHLAISEYAPGRDVVVNELVYKSVGIAMQTQNGNIIEEQVGVCDCGYVTKQSIVNPNSVCPNCGKVLHPLFSGQATASTTSIEPIAFYADEPTRHTSSSNRAYRTRPALLDSQPWPAISAGQTYFVRTPKGDSSVLYVNEGNGKGYALCPWCGRMEAEDTIQNGGRNCLPVSLRRTVHSRPDSGAACGNINIQRNVVLTSEIKTNLTEIRIVQHRNMTDDEHRALMFSLGTVMSRKFAEILGVESDEIDFGLTDANTLFIFDTHCGGSCYSNRLSSQTLLEKLFDNCRSYLKSCSCPKACTNCLVDRKSQYHIDDLDRNIAIEWLDWEFSQRNIVPDALQRLMPNANICRITTPIENRISQVMQQGAFSWAKFFMDARHIMSADIFGMVQHDMDVAITTLGKSISLLINRVNVGRMSLRSLCDMQQHNGLYGESSCHWTNLRNVYPILATDNDLYVMYDDAGEENYYQISDYTADFAITDEEAFDPIRELAGKGTDSNRLFKSISVDEYLGRILGSGVRNIDDYMDNNHYRGTTVNIDYTDIYVKSPAACVVLCNVIKQFVEKYNLTIGSLTVYTTSQFDGNTYNRDMNDDFASDTERNRYLTACAKTLLNVNVFIVTNQGLPHDRLLRFNGVNTGLYIEIEPNGGFANGWKLQDEYTRRQADNNCPVTDNFYMFNTKSHLGLKFTYAWK